MRVRSSSWPSWLAVLCSLPLVLASFAFFPATSQAIPVAGNYLLTSGLTGTFTSDGNKLTAWAITDAFNIVWTPTTTFSSAVLVNGADEFIQGQDQLPLHGLIIDWTLNEATSFNIFDFNISTITYKVVSNVPEPSGLALVGLGLGVLALYGVRQRRQTELQVG